MKAEKKTGMKPTMMIKARIKMRMKVKAKRKMILKKRLIPKRTQRESYQPLLQWQILLNESPLQQNWRKYNQIRNLRNRKNRRVKTKVRKSQEQNAQGKRRKVRAAKEERRPPMMMTNQKHRLPNPRRKSDTKDINKLQLYFYSLSMLFCSLLNNKHHPSQCHIKRSAAR